MKNLYKSSWLLLSVTGLVLLLLVLDIYLYRYNVAVFWCTFPLFLLASGLALGKLFQIRQSEFWYFEQIAKEIKCTDVPCMENLPFPAAMLDKNNCIIWCNDAFKTSFYTPSKEESSIEVVTYEPLELFGREGRTIEYSGRSFRVFSNEHKFRLSYQKGRGGKKPIFEIIPDGETRRSEKDALTMLVFADETEYRSLKKQQEDSKPIVMVVLVDNYEELLSGAKESERANLTIQVDRLIEDYFAGKTAILRKVSVDKFFIVIEEKYLQQMYAERMSLLDKAHEIIVRDRAAVTLSIGVGETAETLADSERFAEEMLSNALDRGGDQALVKTEGAFITYGANSAGRERTGKVKIRLAAESIKNLISTADTVYIMGHSFGDFDAAGSSIGLTCAIRRLGIPAYTVAPYKDERRTNAKPLFDRMAKDADFFIMEPEQAEREFTSRSVLIVVDTHIEKKVESQKLLSMCDKSRLVIIDHHRLSAGAITDPAVRIQESNASSTAEIVTELIQYFSGSILITPLEAEALLAGIMLDTKDFVMRTVVSTFEAAAYLKKIGADTIAVKKLFDTTIESKARKAEIITAAEIYHGCCAISVVTDDFPGIRIVCSQAADEMLYISNVDAAFTVYPIEGGWSFSARSLGKVNVQMIMESLGNKKDDGGGHQSMAGAQLYDITIDEAVDKLHAAIDEHLANVSTEDNRAEEA